MHPCFVHGLEESRRRVLEYHFPTKNIPIMVTIQSKL